MNAGDGDCRSRPVDGSCNEACGATTSAVALAGTGHLHPCAGLSPGMAARAKPGRQCHAWPPRGTAYLAADPRLDCCAFLAYGESNVTEDCSRTTLLGRRPLASSVARGAASFGIAGAFCSFCQTRPISVT